MTMDPAIDVDAWCQRIGYSGMRSADLATLRTLHRLHPLAIAFENLDPFLHRPVSLDLRAIEEKLVHGRRGGWCFEHNLLFQHALRAFGFDVSALAARVLWKRPADAITPRGHMLLQVVLAGTPYVCDVGFGGLTLTAPLRLDTGGEQKTPHEPFRLAALDDGYRLEARLAGQWQALYRFTLEEAFPCDHELSNHFLSTHDSSHFRHGLIAARPLSAARVTLANTRLTHYDSAGHASHETLASAGDIADALEQHFGVVAPDSKALERAMRRENLLPPAP